MAFNVATVCLKDDPTTTPEDVIKLKLSMDANRLLVHEGMQISVLNVFTDYEKSDFLAVQPRWASEETDPNVPSSMRLTTIESTDNSSHAIKNLFRNDRFGEHDKIMYMHPRVKWRNLGHSIIFSTLPDKGNPNHSSYTINEEDRKSIIENNWATLNLAVDWTESEDTQFMPQFFQFNYAEHPDLTEKMFDGTLDKYDSFMHFVEGEYTEFVLPMMPATLGKYYSCNHDKNKELNEMYEKNVRPLFPEHWRGTGGDEEAKFLSFNHDWRDMTKQCSLLFFDETDGPISDDYFAQMYLVSNP